MTGYIRYQNFKNWDTSQKAAATILFTILSFAAIMATGYIPSMENIKGIFYVLLFSLIISVLSKKFQGENILQHVTPGRDLFSIQCRCLGGT